MKNMEKKNKKRASELRLANARGFLLQRPDSATTHPQRRSHQTSPFPYIPCGRQITEVLVPTGTAGCPNPVSASSFSLADNNNNPPQPYKIVGSHLLPLGRGFPADGVNIRKKRKSEYKNIHVNLKGAENGFLQRNLLSSFP